MKLDKAIQILIDQVCTDEEEIEPDFLDAIELGIEALKRIVNQRSTHGWHPETLLPGEDSIEDRGLSNDRIQSVKTE